MILFLIARSGWVGEIFVWLFGCLVCVGWSVDWSLGQLVGSLAGW